MLRVDDTFFIVMRRSPLETSSTNRTPRLLFCTKVRDLIVDNGVKTVPKRSALRKYFTSPGRLTRPSRHDAYGARACKDSISVSTGDYSKDIGISATGRTRSSDVPADPSVSRTRSYSSDRETSESSRLSSWQT